MLCIITQTVINLLACFAGYFLGYKAAIWLGNRRRKHYEKHRL